MPDYLTQNQTLLGEAKQVVQPLKMMPVLVGEGSRRYFVPCGQFSSPTLGQTVHAGVKFSDKDVSVSEDFYLALANIALIAEKHPEIADQLPVFYGMLTTPKGKPRGVVTQDFSLGGAREVKEYRQFGHANIPDGMVDLFDPFGNDMIQLERAIFYINGERRIGDLNHLHPKEKYKPDWKKLREAVAAGGHSIPLTRLTLEQLFPDENERHYANLVLKACKDGQKEHIDVIHVDPTYRINYSTQINRILDAMVNHLYLDAWRDENHPCKDLVFALAD